MTPDLLSPRIGPPTVVDGRVRLRYLPSVPSAKQTLFLATGCQELFFGGAGGGGKSFALLAAALQFADVPGYSALILRRRLTDLVQPNALISMSRSWLDDRPDASYNANERRWTFASGATLQFGYLANVADVGRYRGAEYHYIGWDELGEFPLMYPYTFLFSRLRRPGGLSREEIVRHYGESPDGLTLLDIPLRVRSAANPGGPGMSWVKKRFVDEATRVAPYIPATFHDNPAMDAEEYKSALAFLPEAERRRMELGDWSIQEIRGALWRLADIKRGEWTEGDDLARFDRIYIGVDPSVGEGTGDETGIIAAGRLPNGRVEILADESGAMHPNMWSARVVTLYERLGATGIVIEKNQGHELLRTQIRDAADTLRIPRPLVLLANARGAKETRAASIAKGYTNPSPDPLIVHSPSLAGGDLESQMVSWVPGTPKAESGVKSPDRVDALVWVCRGLLYPESIDDFGQGLNTPDDILSKLSSW